MFVAKQKQETFQSCLIPHWNEEGSCECLDFSLLMIKKMKHQFYDYLESLTNPQKTYNQQCQNKDWNLDSDAIDGVDSLAILQCKIFQKYELAIEQLISNSISHKEELKNIQNDKQCLIEAQGQGQVQQLSRNAIVQEIVQKVRKMLEKSEQFNLSIGNTSLQELLDSLKNQTKFSLNLSSNFLNIKINTQENTSTNLNPNSPTRLESSSENQLQNEQSPYKQPSQQDSQNEINVPNQKYETAQRQLQFLIKQKQLQKRLHDTLQQVDQLKTLLQEKEKLLSQKDTQLKQMIKNLEKQNLLKNRQEKVKSLKDKVEKESLIRELGFERQRDNFQLFIHKENIDSNIINASEIKKNNKLCSASRNFITNRISSPKITQFPN